MYYQFYAKFASTVTFSLQTRDNAAILVVSRINIYIFWIICDKMEVSS